MYNLTEQRYEYQYTNDELDIYIMEIKHTREYIPFHWHDGFEIMLNTKGSMTVLFQHNTVSLDINDCILINPNTIHAVKSSPDNHFILIELPLLFVSQNIPDIKSIFFDLYCHSKDLKIITKQELLKKIIFDLNVAVQIKPNGYQLRCNSLIFELLFQLYHNFRTTIKKSSKLTEKYQARLSMLITYVNNHYQQVITLREAAGLCHLQPEYFCRFFKKNMGMTFGDYVNEVRIYNAYPDIVNSNLPIQQIADIYGFSNYDTFLKKFKALFSCTPSDLRKRNQ